MNNQITKKTIGLAGLTLGIALAFSMPVLAQEEEEGRFANVKTQKVKAISQKTAKLMEPVRTCLAPEVPEGQKAPDPDTTCALRAIQKIKIATLAGHEQAEVNNLFGYIYYLKEDNNRAINYYNKVIKEPEVNLPLRTRTLKTIAQLYMIEERYPEAIRLFKQWMDTQTTLSANDYALLSQLYFSTGDMTRAIKNIEIALDMNKAQGKIGKKQWYAIQKSAYYEKKNFKKVVSILESLITHYPDIRYWRELGGMFAELEYSDKQLAAYSVVYTAGALTSGSQKVGLAYMYLSADVPYLAAQVLEKGFSDGSIEQTEKNLQLLGSSFYQAREYAAALPWMEEAARKSSSGESYSRLAGIYVDLERYEDAARSAREAIRRGGLKRPDLANLTLGNALYNLKRYDAAISAFSKVTDSRTKKQADDWRKYVQAERKRAKQLKDAGIDIS